MTGRLRAYMRDEAAEPLLASADAVLDAAGDRDFLPSIVTVRGMILGPRDRPRALALLARAVDLASQAGHTYTEGWARAMMIYAHFMAGAIDDAERSAVEAV